jgi:hypothetical protein
VPRPTITATVEAKVNVTLKATTKAMLLARLKEHAELAKEVKSRTARQERIRKEVEDLFVADGQLAALETGADIDGFKVKKVTGTQSTLDKVALMKHLDLSPVELDAFYTTKPKKSHVKIAAPGDKENDHE